jgi:hypothetical protein
MPLNRLHYKTLWAIKAEIGKKLLEKYTTFAG